MAFGSSSATKPIVFLVDDEDAGWFDAARPALARLPAEVIVLGKDLARRKRDGDQIVRIYAKRITEVVSAKNGVMVYVVTDSTFGTHPRVSDAGSRLLQACEALLGEAFKRGVIYSSNPQGASRPNRVECLRRSSDVKADAGDIAAFFASGVFLSPDRLLTVIRHLACLPGVDPSLLEGGPTGGPALCVSTMDGGPPGETRDESWVNVKVATTDRLPASERPFHPSTHRLFRAEALSVIARSCDKLGPGRTAADAAAFIRSTLCPFGSMVSAVDSWSAPIPNFSQGRGALRLAWDLAMTDKQPDTWTRKYLTGLKKASPDPAALARVSNQYRDILDLFTTQRDGGNAFTALCQLARQEYSTICAIVRPVYRAVAGAADSAREATTGGTPPPEPEGVEVYIADKAPAHDRDWGRYLTTRYRIISPMTEHAQIAAIAGPALVLMHGYSEEAIAAIAKDLPADARVALIVVSGAKGKSRSTTSYGPEARVCWRRATIDNGPLEDCLQRFWRVCNDSGWRLPYETLLLEPPGLRDLLLDVATGEKTMRQAARECCERLKLYARAGMTIETSLSEDLVALTDDTRLAELVGAAAAAIDRRGKEIDDPPWAAFAREELIHENLGKFVQSRDKDRFLRGPCSEVDSAPRYRALSAACGQLLERLQGWAPTCSRGEVAPFIDDVTRLSNELRSRVDQYGGDQLGRSTDAARIEESARALIERLNRFLDDWRTGADITGGFAINSGDDSDG